MLYIKKGNILHIVPREIMKAEEVIEQMDAKRALFGLFFAFHNRLQAAGDSFYEEITCKQFFLLACLNLFDENPPTANEIAEVMGCSRQSVKEILTSLEKKQFIELVPDEKDMRKKRIVATENAVVLGKKYSKREVDFLETLYDGISDREIKSTFRVVSHLEKNLIKIKENLL